MKGRSSYYAVRRVASIVPLLKRLKFKAFNFKQSMFSLHVSMSSVHVAESLSKYDSDLEGWCPNVCGRRTDR